MTIVVRKTDLPGVLLIAQRVFSDERGFFRELYREELFTEAGLRVEFVQNNLSYSHAGVVRGLHLQHPNGQARLVSVLRGEIWDVVVDARRDSPLFGRWAAFPLTADEGTQVFVPAGFLHGFVVTGVEALVSYQCTTPYRPSDELTILWNDPALGITWPVTHPRLSEKDAAGLRLEQVPSSRLPLTSEYSDRC